MNEENDWRRCVVCGMDVDIANPDVDVIDMGNRRITVRDNQTKLVHILNTRKMKATEVEEKESERTDTTILP